MKHVTGILLLVLTASGAAPDAPGNAVDRVLNAYVQAVGGLPAVEGIQTREVDARRHHGPKLKYLWQKPNKVLLTYEKVRIGFDGSGGWMLSSKKKVTKLGRGAQIAYEMDANPLRFVYLHQLYPDLKADAPAMLEGRKMDVLIAANDLGATKLFYDSGTHLLARVEEKGEVSAYYKHVTDFSEYRDVDGVKLPFRIVHLSEEPGRGEEEIRISKVTQNVPVNPQVFIRPKNASVVLGGKR